MKTTAQTTFAERLGLLLGRAWRGYAHLDRQAHGWLLARGWASGAAKATLRVVKLVALGLMLYAAFWLALLAVFAVVAARAARNADWESDEASRTAWQYGPAGYGLYTLDGHRIDPHDPEDEQD